MKLRSTRFPGRRASDRKGAVAVLMMVMMFAILGVMAVTIDVTRLMSIRAELQTAVDAAALSGVVELMLGGGDEARDTAILYAGRNHAEKQPVVITDADVVFGVWDPDARTFTPLPGAAGANAMEVRATKTVNNWFAWALDIMNSGTAARAVAWASAPVGSTSECVKPWALPEELLDVNGDGDVDQWEVDQSVQTQREFTLKSATGGVADELDASTGIPSFFYPVVLPPFFHCTTTGPDGCQEGETQQVQGGASVYRDNIANCFEEAVGVQDSLLVEPGNMPGPTVQGARRFCPQVDGIRCLNEDGTQGVPMIATFWDSEVDPIGRASVEVARLGSFLLMEVYPQGQHGVIRGVFVEEATPGEITNVATTLVRPILVE